MTAHPEGGPYPCTKKAGSEDPALQLLCCLSPCLRVSVAKPRTRKIKTKENDLLEERVVFASAHALDKEREFHGVVITPHGGLTTRNLLALRNMVPTVRAMVDAVQQEALMLRIGGEIRLVEDRVGNRETGLGVFRATLLIASLAEVFAQTN